MKTFPDQSASFFFRSDERRDLPVEKPAKVPPQYSAIATRYLTKVVRSILSENFQKDVQEVLEAPPNLFYADMLEKFSPDEELNNEDEESYFTEEQNRGSGDNQMNCYKNSLEDKRSDGEPIEIYAVSPRITLDRQADDYVHHEHRQSRKNTAPSLSELLDCAENQEDAMKVMQSHHEAQSNVLRYIWSYIYGYSMILYE